MRKLMGITAVAILLGIATPFVGGLLLTTGAGDNLVLTMWLFSVSAHVANWFDPSREAVLPLTMAVFAVQYLVVFGLVAAAWSATMSLALRRRNPS